MSNEELLVLADDIIYRANLLAEGLIGKDEPTRETAHEMFARAVLIRGQAHAYFTARGLAADDLKTVN